MTKNALRPCGLRRSSKVTVKKLNPLLATEFGISLRKLGSTSLPTVGKIAGSIDAIIWTLIFIGENRMKILIIARRSKHHKPEDFAPHSDAEAVQAFDYMEEDFF